MSGTMIEQAQFVPGILDTVRKSVDRAYSDEPLEANVEPAPILVDHTVYRRLVAALREAGIEFEVERPGDPISLDGLILQATRKCAKCRDVLALDLFARNRADKMDATYECRRCISIGQRERYVNNLEDGKKYTPRPGRRVHQ